MNNALQTGNQQIIHSNTEIIDIIRSRENRMLAYQQSLFNSKIQKRVTHKDPK